MKIPTVPRIFWAITLLAGWLAHAQTSHVVVVNMGDATASVYTTNRITTGDSVLKLLKVLPVGKAPNEACISPNGQRAYVSNRGDISVTVIDLDALTVASTITDPAMKSPDGCLVSADGTKLYVAASGAEAVFVFSTADGSKLTEIKVGHEPRRLLFSADGSRLFVSNGDDRSLSIIDPKKNAVIGEIKAGHDPRPMALMPGGKYMAVANVSDDTVQFIKLDSNETEIVVGVPRSPQRLVVVPSKELLFSIGRVDNVVSIMDIRPNSGEYGRFIMTLPVGHAPWGLALSAAGDSVYVTNTADNTISSIDLRLMKVGFTFPTGKGPMGIAVH